MTTPPPSSTATSTTTSTASFTVPELEAQEAELELARFTYEDAWALGTLLRELAVARRAPVTIDIHRGAQQLFRCALPGSTPDNDAWVDRKRRVTERYAAASYLVGARFRAKNTTFEASSRLDPDTYAAHGGSFPLRVTGTGVIGTVTVSGLPQVEDHALVVEGLRAFKGREG
ncbi:MULTISPECIES: heme-degrading domain-containing protein [unclassified Streptomyces]|uniref:UPF0303 protein OHV25_22880 n=1 Tax=Streptomyces sp. NBC_00060 TaxID=2975636 RepID=A0AAU2H4S8_9ACTN